MEEKLENIEFETKYRVEQNILMPFKWIVEKMPTFKDFVYAEGPDEYYVNGKFVKRYRREANKGPNARAEITTKYKTDSKNNIIRKEYNIRVDNTPRETIVEALKEEGYELNFIVMKSCFIYHMSDATLVFYTVADVTDGTLRKEDHFVEIEVSEELIHTMTESQAWEILTRYEKLLAPCGISPQKRLKLSLYEMYKHD